MSSNECPQTFGLLYKYQKQQRKTNTSLLELFWFLIRFLTLLVNLQVSTGITQCSRVMMSKCFDFSFLIINFSFLAIFSYYPVSFSFFLNSYAGTVQSPANNQPNPFPQIQGSNIRMLKQVELRVFSVPLCTI